MLESFLILTRTGVLLWAAEAPTPAVLDAVSTLVREQVLPDRGCGAPFPSGAYTMRCLLHLDQLIFVAVAFTQTLSYAAYAEPLLRQVRDSWVALYAGRARSEGAALVEPSWEAGADERAGWSALACAPAAAAPGFAAGFGETYEGLKDAAERAQEGRRVAAAPPPPPAAKAAAAATAAVAADTAAAGGGGGGSGGTPSAASPPGTPSRVLTPQERARLAVLGKRVGSGAQGGKAAAGAGAGAAQAEGRTWGEDFRYDPKKASELDCSKKAQGPGAGGGGGGGGGGSREGAEDGSAPALLSFSPEARALAGAELLAPAPLSPPGAGAQAQPVAALSWWSRATSWAAGVTGASITLTPQHLTPVCEQLKTVLVERNVSEGVADVITAAVAARLTGQVLEGGGLGGGSLSARLQAHFTDALRDSLERILCPTEPLDLQRDAVAKKEVNAALPAARRAPYVVVFCGVNGVGKSTTLAKVAFMLREGGCKVLIAACDSFRSGAVEQLKKHCAALGVELYEQGYQKDPAEIARAGIRRAVERGADVVLVDTAGRMQNNAQLMQQLARLVGLNRPDMVLFVGEALVGGDGVDQLREFNRALVDHAQEGAARGIDGIVLTKFDTVDRKVGAALSMVHACNIPIAYLGVGQSYTDIRRLNVGAVLASLLAP